MNSVQKNKELVTDLFTTAFINHNLSGLDRFLCDDYIQHNPDVAQGRSGFEEFHKIIFQAMPDFRQSLKQVIAEGDFVWVYSTVTGTHTGGPWLDVQPTGNRLCFDVVDMFRIEAGKIAEHWDVADTLKLFSQLGTAVDNRSQRG